MQSRWTDSGARRAVTRWGDSLGEQLAIRLYTARLIGQDGDLVLHGGGNVSVKSERRSLLGDRVETVHVKASGCDLSTIEPAGLPALRIDPLRRLRKLDALDDDEMVNQFRTNLLDASAPTPSIETLLHAFLPHRFVDHSHADAVMALTNQPGGERLIREALGDRVAIVPYVKAGFALAKAVAEAVARQGDAEGVVLLHHGLVTFADDARISYERHVALVDACERFIAGRVGHKALSQSIQAAEPTQELAARVAPLLRGLLACDTGDEDRPYGRLILDWRGEEDLLAILNSNEAKDFAAAAALTGDHLIRTGARPLFVENPGFGDEVTLRQHLSDAVDAYRRDQETYVTTHGGSAEGLDSSPRVVLLPGAGLFAWGVSKRDATIAADIAEHALRVQSLAHRMNGYESLPDRHLFDMEHRGLQRAKLDRDDNRPLAGQVVAISGAAGAIGSSIAEVCAEAGAHIVATDLDAARLDALVQRIERAGRPETARAIVVDVTDEGSVRRGFNQVARTFGGVDVIVLNAGIAHVAPIDELALDDFQRVMNVNATGCLLFMREGIRLLKRQGLGGNIVVVSSKNVLGPGRDFGAYSASKAAAHQLGRVAAIELAPHGIRVNMVTPDAVFGDEVAPSGLWRTVGPQRAKSRGMSEKELADFYRGRSLLKIPVRGRHVGNAVVFFASNATPTTGAVLPVDGGVVEAFPR